MRILVDLVRERGKALRKKIIQIGDSIPKNNFVLNLTNSKSWGFLKKISNSSFSSIRLQFSNANDWGKLGTNVIYLSRMLPKCLDSVSIRKFYLSQKDIQHIINSSLNWKIVKFDYWKLDYEDIYLTSKSKSKIETLDFEYSGNTEASNWKRYPQRFKKLLKAISKSTIKDSLKNLVINQWGVTKKQAKEFLTSLRMKKVKVYAFY